MPGDHFVIVEFNTADEYVSAATLNEGFSNLSNRAQLAICLSFTVNIEYF